MAHLKKKKRILFLVKTKKKIKKKNSMIPVDKQILQHDTMHRIECGNWRSTLSTHTGPNRPWTKL